LEADQRVLCGFSNNERLSKVAVLLVDENMQCCGVIFAHHVPKTGEVRDDYRRQNYTDSCGQEKLFQEKEKGL